MTIVAWVRGANLTSIPSSPTYLHKKPSAGSFCITFFLLFATCLNTDLVLVQAVRIYGIMYHQLKSDISEALHTLKAHSLVHQFPSCHKLQLFLSILFPLISKCLINVACVPPAKCLHWYVLHKPIPFHCRQCDQLTQCMLGFKMAAASFEK